MPRPVRTVSLRIPGLQGPPEELLHFQPSGCWALGHFTGVTFHRGPIRSDCLPHAGAMLRADVGLSGFPGSSGHKRRIPLAVVLPRPGRGAGTLIPSAQRFVWAASNRLQR